MSIKLIAFQGPSASGKSTLQNLLGLPKLVTWTSRLERDGEVDGKDYYFTSKEQMQRMFQAGELLEMTEYQDNYYGTSIESIRNIAVGDEPYSIVVEAEGAKKLKQLLKNKMLLIGVVANLEDCERRLELRNITEREVARRLFTYHKEMEQLSHCDKIILNSDENRDIAVFMIRSIKEGLVIYSGRV